MVGSADEARHAVESALYPPAGARGMAGSLRAGAYGRWKTYGADANAGMCVLIQIESKAGLDNLDGIVAVPGLGGIVLGPSDLSNSIGIVGQPDHPKVMEALRHVIDVAHKAKLPIGSIATDPKTTETFIDMGMDFLAIANDSSLLVRALDEVTAKWRPRFS
jgi:2-keto-3-deoxy-L-rhamnonate aldolase RhmA